MNDFRVCVNNHYVFGGFTVQPGMIFGYGEREENIITNGKPYKGGFWIYTNLGSLDGEFERIHITKESHPKIFHKIEKALRQRSRKGMDGVQYRTQAQLELERWDADPYQRFFKDACRPVGKTPKVIATKDEAGAARYNAIKERSTMTQNISLCQYNAPKGQVIII